MEAPSFTSQQIEYLNGLYPERTPDKNMTEREIWIAVGQRTVVRHLNTAFESQLERQMIK
jgi:hypothetical protein